MVYVRKKLADVAFQDETSPCVILARFVRKRTKTIHGAMRTFSQTTRVGIRNECAVKELIELAVERMM